MDCNAGDIYVPCYGFPTFPEDICIGIIILCLNYIIEFIPKLLLLLLLSIFFIDFYHYIFRLLATGLLLNLCSVVVHYFTYASHRVPHTKKNLVFFKCHIRLLVSNMMSVIDV